jgi:hypothetical protein
MFSLNHLLFIKNHSKVFYQWKKRQFAAPSPDLVKHQVLLTQSIPGATWIETGTYLGDTTYLLSRHAKLVYTIEPEPILFKKAEARFRHEKNIKVINGLSEDVLPRLLPEIAGAINFWLDGHDSGGSTYKGPQETPIVDELNCISRYRHKFTRAVVLIDDVRLFTPTHKEYTGSYPNLDFLVAWARDNEFQWSIMHDIFVASSSEDVARKVG